MNLYHLHEGELIASKSLLGGITTCGGKGRDVKGKYCARGRVVEGVRRAEVDEGSPKHKQTPRALHLPRQVGRRPPTAPPSHIGDHRGPSVCRLPHRNNKRTVHA